MTMMRRNIAARTTVAPAGERTRRRESRSIGCGDATGVHERPGIEGLVAATRDSREGETHV